MSVEKPKEFVGSDEPYETRKAEAKELARKAQELDEERKQALREGEIRRAETLAKERERTMEAQRKILHQIAELKKYPLR